MKKFIILMALAFSIAGFGQAPALVKNINPNTYDPNSHSDPAKGNDPNYPDTGIGYSGKFFFPARNFNGIELWQTNGFANATSIVRDLTSYYSGADANPLFLTRIGFDIYFFTADWDGNTQRYKNFILHKCNATSGQIDHNFFLNGLNDVRNVVTDGNDLYFIAYPDVNNNIHNLTDTSLVKVDAAYGGLDIISSDHPREAKLIQLQSNYIAFDANDGTNGRELWLYDIDNNSTDLALDVNVGSGSSNPHDFIAYDNAIFFTADDGGTDGMQLKYLNLSTYTSGGFTFGVYNSNPHNKTVFGDQLFSAPATRQTAPVLMIFMLIVARIILFSLKPPMYRPTTGRL